MDTSIPAIARHETISAFQTITQSKEFLHVLLSDPE
jgi:hypothetical protein